MRHPALLVIDVQKFYTTPGLRTYIDDCEPVIERINRLIAAFERKRFPVIYIQHMYRADGADAGRMWDYTGTRKPSSFITGTDIVDYADSLHQIKNRFEIDKHRYSSFKQTELDQLLKSEHIDTVVVTGFMTNFCCETTAREAHDLDYYVYFLSDATSCPFNLVGVERDRVKEVVHASLAAGFAIIKSTDEYLEILAKN